MLENKSFTNKNYPEISHALLCQRSLTQYAQHRIRNRTQVHPHKHSCQTVNAIRQYWPHKSPLILPLQSLLTILALSQGKANVMLGKDRKHKLWLQYSRSMSHKLKGRQGVDGEQERRRKAARSSCWSSPVLMCSGLVTGNCFKFNPFQS